MSPIPTPQDAAQAGHPAPRSGHAEDLGIPHDDAAHLIRMANQIATAFRLEPDDKAITAMREHIGKFWTRAMRERLKALATTAAPDLDARIRRAFG